MHLNPHAKCRSSKFNLKLFKKERWSLKTWKHIKEHFAAKLMTVGDLCLFLMVHRVGLRYVIMVVPGHIHFLTNANCY